MESISRWAQIYVAARTTISYQQVSRILFCYVNIKIRALFIYSISRYRHGITILGQQALVFFHSIIGVAIAASRLASLAVAAS